VRCRAAAIGQRVVLVSLANYKGPFLDEFRMQIAPGETVEIGETVQEGRREAPCRRCPRKGL
jgi:hypothetical protein